MGKGAHSDPFCGKNSFNRPQGAPNTNSKVLGVQKKLTFYIDVLKLLHLHRKFKDKKNEEKIYKRYTLGSTDQAKIRKKRKVKKDE